MMRAYVYDSENILAKVLRGDLPSEVVEDALYTLAIRDIRPQAPDHILVLPKGPYICFDHFMTHASAEETADFFATVNRILERLNISPDRGGQGYRLIANTGADGFQEIAHFHMHILSGRWLGPLLPGATDVAAAEAEFGPKLSNEALFGSE